MHRLYLPDNIPVYGSTPVFTDSACNEKVCCRTGYALEHVAASDPNPRRNRKKYVGGLIDASERDVVEWEQRHPGMVDED